MKKLWFLFLAAAMMVTFATNASALVRVDPGGHGDALIGELVRIDGGFVTFFSIANTDPNNYVEIHVRLRTGRYSIEIWDKQFNLTPEDKIWFQLGEDEGGLYILWEGLNFAGRQYLSNEVLEDVWFSPFDIDEMRVNYVEVFGIGAGATESQSQNANTGFDVGNVLFGNVYLGDFTTGEYLGYNMLAFADFRTNTAGIGHRDLDTSTGASQGPGSGYIDKEIYVDYGWGPVRPYYQPDWATTYGPSWNDGDDDNASGLVTDPSSVWSLDEVEAALQKSLIRSDYFNRMSGTDSLTTTLVCVTFPAKYLHFNFALWNPAIDNDAEALKRRAAVVNGVGTYINRPSSVPIRARVFDYEEAEWKYSPSSTPPLPWEINLIPVGDLSQVFFAESWFLAGATGLPGYIEYPFNAAYLQGWDMGWFEISFQNTFTYDVDFVRGADIFPGENLIMDYETINYPHARGRGWHFVR